MLALLWFVAWLAGLFGLWVWRTKENWVHPLASLLPIGCPPHQLVAGSLVKDPRVDLGGADAEVGDCDLGICSGCTVLRGPSNLFYKQFRPLVSRADACRKFRNEVAFVQALRQIPYRYYFAEILGFNEADAVIVYQRLPYRLGDLRDDTKDFPIPVWYRLLLLHDIAVAMHAFQTILGGAEIVVHRDLHAMNIMLTADPARAELLTNCRPVIIDPARARSLNAQFMSSNPGAAVAAPPEAVTGRYNHTYDIFSFGVLIGDLFATDAPSNVSTLRNRCTAADMTRRPNSFVDVSFVLRDALATCQPGLDPLAHPAA